MTEWTCEGKPKDIRVGATEGLPLKEPAYVGTH